MREGFAPVIKLEFTTNRKPEGNRDFFKRMHVVPLRRRIVAGLCAEAVPDSIATALEDGRAALEAAQRVVSLRGVAWVGAWYAEQISKRLGAFSGLQDLDEIERLLRNLQGQVAALRDGEE